MPQQQPAPQRLPDAPHRWTGDYQLGLYTRDYRRTVFYESSGKMPAAVQGPAGTPCEIVQTSAPCGGKVVEFEVERFGLMPLVPGKEASDANQVYLDGQVNVTEQTSSDGSRKWYNVSGWYRYALLRPLSFGTDALPLGTHVTDRTDPADNVLPAVAFVDGTKPLKGQPAAGDSLAILQRLAPKLPQ